MATATNDRMFSTKINFDMETREKLIALCKQQLADTADLHS